MADNIAECPEDAEAYAALLDELSRTPAPANKLSDAELLKTYFSNDRKPPPAPPKWYDRDDWSDSWDDDEYYLMSSSVGRTGPSHSNKPPRPAGDACPNTAPKPPPVRYHDPVYPSDSMSDRVRLIGWAVEKMQTQLTRFESASGGIAGRMDGVESRLRTIGANQNTIITMLVELQREISLLRESDIRRG